MSLILEKPTFKRKSPVKIPQKEVELLPCKSCGGIPAIFWGTDLKAGSYWWARCRCGATAPWAYDRGKASVRWNRAFGKAVKT